MQRKQTLFWIVFVCLALMVCVTGSAFAATTGSVKGKVHKNSASGSDLSGVKVSCGGKSDTTDSNGKFEIKKISVGNQTLSFSKSGYQSFQTSVKIVKDKTANIGDRWLTENKPANGSISGRLHKNAASGSILSGVTISGGSKNTTSGGDGSFKLDGLAAGDHAISFSKFGYGSYQTNVKVVASKNANIGDRWLIENTQHIATSNTIDLKSWQREKVNAVMNKLNTRDYVEGQCTDRGQYTWCYGFARQFYGLPKIQHADDAFYELKKNPTYKNNIVVESTFNKIPIGSLVFWRGGSYGHAAIKVNESDIVGEGNPQINKNDMCIVTKVKASSINLPLLGYYVP